jgi:cyclophilin family peptidyl-prolyl cis-trans isomerase
MFPVGAGAASAGPAADKWDSTYTQWKELLAQLRELREKYKTAEEDQLPSLRLEYRDLVAKGSDLIERLRADGVAAYKEAPNEDRVLAKFLVKLTEDDLRSDRYERAADLAQLLLDNDCEENQLYNSAGVAAFALHDFEKAKEYFDKGADAGALKEDGQKYAAEVDNYIELWKKEQEIRKAEAEADDLPRVKIETNKGELVVELFENEAPQTVGNFINLVERNFYDGLTFHRVLPNFMAQGGCPQGTGEGGPLYNIYDEHDRDDARMHFRGCLSMANTGRKNTGGSQFFLTFVPTPSLNNKHTVFGRVIEGIDVLERIQRRDPEKQGNLPEPDKIIKMEVVRKRPDKKYVPTKVQ